ncbi:MAG TPA: hypothetical protein VIJ33_04100 [Solirubrobacteraceae bacterium]
MRTRALLLLLVLTAGDYLLWQWSIAGSHDILSLLAGFTLVPLVAVSAWRLALAGAGMLSYALGRPSAGARAARAAREAEAARQPPPDPAVEPNSSSGRLAA